MMYYIRGKKMYYKCTLHCVNIYFAILLQNFLSKFKFLSVISCNRQKDDIVTRPVLHQVSLILEVF